MEQSKRIPRGQGSRAGARSPSRGGRPSEGQRGGAASGGDRGARAYRPSTSGHTSYRPQSAPSARPSYGATTGGGNPYRGGGNASWGDSQATSATPRYGARPSSSGSRGPSRTYSPRPSFGGSRGGSRSGGSFGGGNRGGGNKGMRGEHIDVSRFINKAIITEEVEHFVPEHAFDDFKIVPALKKAIATKGYTQPTPIQDRSIPHILHGVDVVGIANTGTGKTGAFLIPIINKVLANPTESALIVVPTRELALQIDEELQGFIKGSSVRSVCCFGGANISRQIEALKSHRHFVIGTPGRLKDLLERKKLNLSRFRTVVLDEADRMLDMGFVHDMRVILKETAAERQTLFFSATLSSDIEKLIHEFLREPVRISVKTRDTSKNIDQDVIYVPKGGDKVQVLLDLVKDPAFGRVLVFGRTKHGVDKLTKALQRGGVTAESIHGNKNNSKRQLALRQFKEGRIRVLVATDVAARGLDISNVSHVINYDIPATYDDYVHRIGRTGRADKKGIALTMVEK